HPDVSAPNVRLVNSHQKADEQDDLTDLECGRHDLRSIDARQRCTEELLVIKHSYLRFNASVMFSLRAAPCCASIFISAAAFARSTPRSPTNSALAPWVCAFARTSHAAAPASSIGALPGAAPCTCSMIWSAAWISRSAIASISIARFIAAWATAS